MNRVRNIFKARRSRPKAKPGVAAAPEVGADILMSDRGVPAWTRGLSYVFAATASLSLLSVAVFATFLHDLVGQQGQLMLATLLGMAGVVPVLGALILDFAHTRALNGYRDARLAHEAAARAAIGVLALVVLALVHPLLGAGIAVGAAFGWLGLVALRAFAQREPLWDFRPDESVGVLSGRDTYGHALASTSEDERGFALWPSIKRAAVWLSLLIVVSAGSWLAAREIISLPAITGAALITLWAVGAICTYAELRIRRSMRTSRVADMVQHLPLPEDESAEPRAGLLVRGLTVENAQGRRLLSDIHLEVPPGTIIGVRGEAGAGKTMLLSALADPHGLAGLRVRGHATLNDADLWERDLHHESVPCVYLPEVPVLLPASGAENLACFRDDGALNRGKRILEQIVFATDTVDQICATPNAQTLPGSQRKALAIARAFLLNPGLYLMDRPEDAASDKLIRALTARMMQEKRLGRSFILITEDRSILECCDQLLVLQGGRVIEAGDAEEIRGRMSSGWARMVAARSLDSEDNLDRWIRSHFKRDGDEANRRKTALIASELLAFSCQSASTIAGHSITFEFKHFEGHCILRMLDDDGPVTTAQLERAREEAERQQDGARLSPLALVISKSVSIEAVMDGEKRAVIAKIGTYDPRKSQTQQAPGDAQRTN